MSKSLKKAKRCYGCGAVLQTEDPELEGYVSKDVSLENDVVLCNNCYSLRNYNEETHLKPIISQEFFKIIDNAKKTNSLFVYIVDLFNFESSFISEINEALKGSTVLLVANKRDLLPSSVKDEKLFEYVKKRTEEAGLIVSEIMLASSTTNYNIDLFLERMAELRNNRNVYVIGSVSSGKSSFINTVLRVYKNETSHYISTSIYPNTTLKVVEIPIDETTSLYETPGLAINNSVLGLFEKEVIRTIVPRKEIKPRVYYQIPANYSLLIGGLARIDFLSGSRTTFKLYLAPGIKVIRIPTPRASKTFENLIKNEKTVPISKKIKGIQDLDAFDISFSGNDNVDISIAGLGWISFKEKNQEIRVFAPQGVAVTTNQAKI